MTQAAAVTKKMFKPHVAPRKKDIVKGLVKQLENYPIIGVLNMQNLPAAQLAKMKRDLRGKIEIAMTKRRLMLLALETVKDRIKGIEHLKEHLKGMPALMFTKDNPFAIYATLKKAKSPAPAKAGQIAPRDIVIPKGPTPFTPGPIISELAQLGIKSGVENGKVAVKEDTVLVEEGKAINEGAASLLLRLGIQPMEIGLDLRMVLEDGTVYQKKVLDIDEERFMADVMQAAGEAFNLSVESCYLTADNIELLLGKGVREAHAIVDESSFPAQGAVEGLLAKAERIATGLKEEVKE